MICPKCGADTPDNAAFCPNCGAQLGRTGGASASRPPKAARIEQAAAGRAVADAPEEEVWSGAYSSKAMTPAFVGAALLTTIGMIAAWFSGPAGWAAAAVCALVVFGY